MTQQSRSFEDVVQEAWNNEGQENMEWHIDIALEALRSYVGSEDFAVKDGQVMRLVQVDYEKDILLRTDVVCWVLPPKQNPRAPNPEIKPDYQTAGESWAEADQQPPWRGIKP